MSQAHKNCVSQWTGHQKVETGKNDTFFIAEYANYIV